MIDPIDSPYLAPFDGSFRVDAATTAPPKDAPGKKDCKQRLVREVERLDELQRVLYAEDHHAILCIFQAMDAAGKDSTIRAVFSGVNPAGFQVSSFKKPSPEELDHDFLWRSTIRLPQRGRIGVFNRSYYEEVLVVRVHAGILDSQRLPERPPLEQLFAERYESIRDHEHHLARNGTVILKFWLHVSPDEQARRFLSRLEEPEKRWKFSAGDLAERRHWDTYMEAYQRAIAETSRPHAPWFAIPADDKPYMRWQVARILRKTLERLDLEFPVVPEDEAAAFPGYQEQLRGELAPPPASSE